MLVRLLLISVLSFSPFLLQAPARAESGATAGVKAVLDKAMDIQTQPALAGDANKKERAKLIRQLIADNFMPSEMARNALEGQWERLSAGQRTEFQNLFIPLFQQSYTRMVLNFLQKETIEYRGESETGKAVLVKTVIMRANEHIPVNYSVIQKGNRWLIRHVEIDGVSIVENYRNTFRKAIQTSSFDGLMQKMRIQQKASSDET